MVSTMANVDVWPTMNLGSGDVYVEDLIVIVIVIVIILAIIILIIIVIVFVCGSWQVAGFRFRFWMSSHCS